MGKGCPATTPGKRKLVRIGANKFGWQNKSQKNYTRKKWRNGLEKIAY
jgi:hypothetical protein